ncbi:conserved hypothetical protein [Neospora caninum Liverpool]|uniref:Uncharacterized protein n=1 Tax=Neospora caninum (strain Liverpool) TaxID=572307 RepID=F0VJD2_NEOCL|nr:conserved hypothetical protein [Neospora caninum Liverpool]CBZ53843.1 conserved hypothetical protein [Neospora caninum Liverpool]|eukprot:XP_003883875.1 conserved hypothetical protein [Neospora caninum Liverpool]
MRFGTFRTAYRVATRHFGSNVAYRQYYQAPRTVTAMMPYLCTRTNPVTLRLEDQAADGSSNVKQLFSTSMSGSALLSPVSELSSLGPPALVLEVYDVVSHLSVTKMLFQSPWDKTQSAVFQRRGRLLCSCGVLFTERSATSEWLLALRDEYQCMIKLMQHIKFACGHSSGPRRRLLRGNDLWNIFAG